MTAIKTQIGAKDPATQVPFGMNDGGIPETDTESAITFVYNAALSLSATAQYTADAARELALQIRSALHALSVRVRILTTRVAMTEQTAKEARSAAQTLGVKMRAVQEDATAANAMQTALQARGLAANGLTKIRKLDDVQIALKAQVFN